MKKLITILSTIIATLNVSAQTTIENFNYGSTTDTLTNPAIGGSLWKRHSGALGALVYNTTSLSYTGYSSNGVGGSISLAHAAGSREDANFATNTYTSGSVYVSFLMNVTVSGGTTGDYFFHLLDSSGLTTGSNFRARLFVKDGVAANTFKVGISKGSNAANAIFSPLDYPLNTPVLVVLKYTFNTSASDTAYCFVIDSAIPTTEPASATISSTVVADVAIADLSKVKSVVIRQGNVGTAAITIDGIRIATSWLNSTLPVKYTQFTAERNNDNIKLNWSTASEVNNNGFEIERSSNGTDFEKIGFVKGVGNSSRLNKYSFTDKNNSFAYYRLKQVDFDGKYEFSKVLTVKSNESSVELSPNPFNDNLVINSNTTIINAEIVDVTGRVKMFEVVNSNTAKLNTSGLDNGVYFIRINNGEKVITKRIIKN